MADAYSNSDLCKVRRWLLLWRHDGLPDTLGRQFKGIILARDVMGASAQHYSTPVCTLQSHMLPVTQVHTDPLLHCSQN